MDEFFRRVELPISIDEFHRLPRNAAYKYEYWDGLARLTPRPKTFTCVRDLSPVTHPGDPPGVTLRPLPPADIPGLTELFRWSSGNTQPWQSLDDDDALLAAAGCLLRTATGRDGPLLPAACFTAHDEEGRADGPVGAALVTLAPPDILTEPFGGWWRGPPPADAVERRLGVPHLTWVFVGWWHARKGVGTELLRGVVEAVRGQGYNELASTFLLDNGPSALWHWRNGFRLLPQWSVGMKAARVRHEQRAGGG
jgi:GNAT superfamily N-acetyltransferase